MEEFAAVFTALDGPRTGNAKRHLLLEILMIALGTVLSGGESCADMALFGRAKERFLRQVLTLPHGIPSHDTFSRVFRLLDPAQFRVCFTAFMQRFAETCRGVVAIAGKTLRPSFDAASGTSPLHLASAPPASGDAGRGADGSAVGRWACAQRLVLGQRAGDGTSNEITALLEMLALEGSIVTVDALNCRRAIAGQVIHQGGDGACPRAGRSRTRGCWRSRATRARCSRTCGSSSTIRARPWPALAGRMAAMAGSSSAGRT